MSQLRHEIPTHLGVEDRAFYGLSARQVMVLTSGAAMAYGLWNQWPALPAGARFALAAACVLLTVALALLRPGGRALEEWLFVVLHYTGTPKRSVWRPREPNVEAWRSTGAGWQELHPRVSWQGGQR